MTTTDRPPLRMEFGYHGDTDTMSVCLIHKAVEGISVTLSSYLVRLEMSPAQFAEFAAKVAAKAARLTAERELAGAT